VKRVFLALAGATVVMLGIGAGTGTAVASSGDLSADVNPIATVVSANTVVFNFDLINCPAGEPMALVDWTATEPDRPEAIAATGGVNQYGLSTGERVQHLTAQAGSAAFLAGATWVGSGSVSCGGTILSVSGSGFAESINGK
jgi:hypothetical protein